MVTKLSVSESVLSHEEGINTVYKNSKKGSDSFPMSNSKTILWAFLIVLFFLGWLGLLIVGLSFDSSEYHEKVFSKKRNLGQDSLIIQVKPKLELYKPEVQDPEPVTLSDIVIYVLSTTPFNVALLAALAAMIGGLASNLTASNRYSHEWNAHIKPNSEEYRTYIYMTENPTVSMVRGFIVYLLVVTGASLTNFTSAVDSTDRFIFAGASAPAYFKFAVTVTLLSYLVGYDPSRLRNLLQNINFSKKEDNPLGDKDGKMLEMMRLLEVKLQSDPKQNYPDQSTNKANHIGQPEPNEKSTKGRHKVNGNANQIGVLK